MPPERMKVCEDKFRICTGNTVCMEITDANDVFHQIMLHPDAARAFADVLESSDGAASALAFLLRQGVAAIETFNPARHILHEAFLQTQERLSDPKKN